MQLCAAYDFSKTNNKYLSTLHIYGDDKVIRQTLKNTAAATTNEIAAYLLNEADSAVNGGENAYNYDLYGYVKYFDRISDIRNAGDKYKE